MTNEKPSDPPIDEIRAIRSQISAEHDHDTRKLVEYYMELQKRHVDRMFIPGLIPFDAALHPVRSGRYVVD